MAVKQYPTESSHCSETPKYNITKILEYIEGIDLDVELETNRTEVCKRIVDLLGHVEVVCDKDKISGFSENIKKVEQFLLQLKQNYAKSDFDFVAICLKELYNIIMTVDNPSPAAGIILHLFELQLIPKATQWFLNNSEYTSDQDIKRGVHTLVTWIKCSHFVKNLHLWIVGILTALREQHKYDLLLDIAIANIDQLRALCAVPVMFKNHISIVILILTSVQHTPVVLHRFIKGFTTNYYHNLKNLEIAQLEAALLALMLYFPATNQQTAAEYERVRGLIKSSSDLKNILNVPPWHDESKYKRRKANDRVGLINLGNTCYMNSVLQALMLTKQFTRDLLLTETRSPLFQNMQRLMALLLHSDRPELSPNSVHQTARPAGFHAGHEQDSSEFLEHLLDQLHEQEKPRASPILDASPPKRRLIHAAAADAAPIDGNAATDESCPMDIDDDPIDADGARALFGSSTSVVRAAHPCKTLIQKSFGGNISITYKCLNCQTESKQFDSFRDLHLSFPDDADDDTNANHSVQDLLDFYCSTEKLEAENKYFCDQCKALCIGERFINIVTAPRNLILTLKHFKYDQKYNMRAKLMHKVRHEDVITVKVFPSSDFKDDVVMHYRLYAAVVHSGVSMETGHYFTYGSDATGCYKFDDSYVSKATVAELHNLQPPHTPYILFYQMVPSPDAVPAISSPKPSTSSAVAGSCASATSAAIARTTSKASSSSGDLATITLCDYPALEDLPPQLREYVNRDNISYSEEMRRQSNASSMASSVYTRNRKNNFYGPPDNDNHDDEPPSSCGTNFAPSYNRYIS